MQSLLKLLVLLKADVEGFDKILRLSISVIFANIFKIIFSFDSVFAHKVLKNVTVPLNRCGIVWIRLWPLDYISEFPTKLLFKLCFGNFRIFLKSYSIFKIFPPLKPTKNHHRSLKEVWHKPNLLFIFIKYVKIFDKFVFLFSIL